MKMTMLAYSVKTDSANKLSFHIIKVVTVMLDICQAVAII